MQALGYNIVELHFDDLSLGKEPLVLNINGVPGTSKKYPINLITSINSYETKLMCSHCNNQQTCF